jgi:hypothetical protein
MSINPIAQGSRGPSVHRQIKANETALPCACYTRLEGLPNARRSGWRTRGRAEWQLPARCQDQGNDRGLEAHKIIVGYKRQIEVYQWLFRRNGFSVRTPDFCLLQRPGCRVLRRTRDVCAEAHSYTGNDAWIEPTLLDLKRCLTSDSPPHASIDCEYCGYAEARKLCSLATNKCL